MKQHGIQLLVIASIAVSAFAAESKSAFIQPAEPKWGEKIQIVYSGDPSDTIMHATDQVTALVTIWFPGNIEERRIRMSRSGNHLQAEMAVPESASFLNCYFVTNDSWGWPAYSMVYDRKGIPARGAWMQSMAVPSSQKDYLGRAARELALYPDNWEMYTLKWFCAIIDLAGQKRMIEADLPQIERGAAGRPLSALYSLTKGYLWLGDETTARAVLREMVTRFPDEYLTADAINGYFYENFVHHFAGNGPAEVGGWWTAFCRRNPRSYSARFNMNGMGGTLLPLETMESICKLWMKDEPDNPKPYLRLSSAYKQGKVRLPEALALSEKALDLLVAGQLRLHGDIFGQMTDSLLPFAYVTAAELASDDGQYAKALAYAKAGETLGSATRPEGFTVEAQIWEALGHPSNAKTALIEAWKRGSEDAQKKLAADYPDVLRNATAAAPDSTRKNSPTFHGTTLDGKEVNFSQLKGKVIVANFWYTGCGPCKAEIPDLNRLARKFQDWDVIFLAFDVNDDEDDAALRRFLKQYPFDYTIVPHAGDTATQFGIHLFPSHVIVDRDGKIESKLEGGGANVQDLETIVARLVGKP